MQVRKTGKNIDAGKWHITVRSPKTEFEELVAVVKASNKGKADEADRWAARRMNAQLKKEKLTWLFPILFVQFPHLNINFFKQDVILRDCLKFGISVEEISGQIDISYNNQIPWWDGF